MNIPDKNERMRIMNEIELNCKQKGKYHDVDLKTYNNFVTDITNKYPAFKNTIVNSLDNPKNIIKEYAKFAHAGAEINDKVNQHWFKNMLLTILKSAKKALSFAYDLIRQAGKAIQKEITKNAVDTVTANVLVVGISLSLGGIVAGLTAAVIMIGLSLWLNKVDKKLHSIDVTDEESWLDKIKKWKDVLVKRIKGKDDVELPEELKAPEPEVPDITVSTFQENQFREIAGLELIGGVIFVIFLKAVIAYRFNEEMKTKITFLKALYNPMGIILSLSSVLMLIGSGGATALVL